MRTILDGEERMEMSDVGIGYGARGGAVPDPAGGRCTPLPAGWRRFRDNLGKPLAMSRWAA